MILLRCVCGRVVGELRGADCGSLALPCQQCRDVLWKIGLERSTPKRNLLVMQTWSLRTGDLTRTEVFKNHAQGDRSRDRGGERLDTAVLTDALQRLRARPRS